MVCVGLTNRDLLNFCWNWHFVSGQMQSVEASISHDIYGVLGVENSVVSRTSEGGTAPSNVAAAAKAARKRFLI